MSELAKFYNGCKDERTMDIYAKLHNIPHIHTFTMMVDDEGNEVIIFSFDHYKDTLHASIKPCVSPVVELEIEFDMVVGDGEKEPVIDFYGFVEFNNLINLLISMPHIGNIIEGVDERLH